MNTRNIVVIDDNHRFAIHVWQFLSSSLAFGVGEISRSHGIGLFYNDLGPRGVPTPAFEDYVWWVDASRTWREIREILSEVLGCCNEGPCVVLVDVRGPRESSGGYNLKALLATLVEAGCGLDVESERHLRLLSAYSKSFFPYKGNPLRVASKSPKTLSALRRKSRGCEPPRVSHILVTGAGFEFLPEFLEGQGHLGTSLGVPRTPYLIEEALRSLEVSEEAKGESADEWEIVWPEGKHGEGFPYPRRWGKYSRVMQVEGDSTRPGKNELLDSNLLHHAAKEGLLDEYWNELLELELRFRMINSGRKTVTGRKLDASSWEYSLREAFRRVFLKYDWGYLNQAVDAAGMDWSVWMSTNYTGFANRAIDLMSKEVGEPWAVISTSNEAARLQRKILHEAERSNEGMEKRLLFKLHGDISHLTTMAIAGHDKEIYSPLSLPIDSLHHIYTTAEIYAQRALSFAETREVVWHVVGHGLADRLLLETIARICRGSQCKNSFVVVNPDPRPVVDILKGRDATGGSVGEVALTAEQYMACFRRRVQLADWTSVEEWQGLFPVEEALCHKEACG